jgi:GNAT superfamily N-acetyltransferase
VGQVTAPTPLTPEHNLGGFRCTHPSLTTWLQTRALKNTAQYSNTFVVCDGANVVGYYCLSAGAVMRDDAPKAMARNAPNIIPLFVIGRLATHLDYEGHGIGRGMVKDAYQRARLAREIVGAKALLVHAIDEKAALWYEEKGGFVRSPIHPLTLMLAPA